MLGLDGFHVLTVAPSTAGVRYEIETGDDLAGCPSCGVVATLHNRRDHIVHDIPGPLGPVTLVWKKRIWRCWEPACSQATWSEHSEAIPARAKLTTRTGPWLVDRMEHDDAHVAALARQLGVDWHTCWNAAKPIAQQRAEDPDRFKGVKAIGVDEHIWKHSGLQRSRAITGMVDLTRDDQGRVHTRLLDVVVGRSGTVYRDWLTDRGKEFTDGIEHAALDPFRGYKNAIDAKLPDAVTVLDAFHVVKLGISLLDDVRRRVQNATTGHRGRKHDPLYQIRRLITQGAEHLTEKGRVKLNDKLDAGDPDYEVTIAWYAYQDLRAVYRAGDLKTGRERFLTLLEKYRTCPVPELQRLLRTLRQWKDEILAYFDTQGASNGPTEAVNNLIEKTRRIAHGFRNFENYRLRILLTASGRPRNLPRSHHA